MEDNFLKLMIGAVEVAIHHQSFKYTDLLDSDKVVLATGNIKAKILVVGRDLGQDEIDNGEVLIGKAGSHFRKRASQVGFNPLTDFLMTNTVPLKPKGNKAFPNEVREYFFPTLREIIKYMCPRFILALGNEANKTFNPLAQGILKESGKMYWWKNNLGLKIQVMPCVHPSYIVRGVQLEEEKRRFLWPIKTLYKNFESS